MSLINDALKRAHESQGPLPDAPPPLIPAPIPTRGGIGWAIPAAVILLLAAGGILIWLAFGHKSPKRAIATAPAAPAAIAVPVAAITPVVASPAPKPAPAPASAVVTQSSAANPAVTPVSNVVEELLPDSWPKVEGIIYTESRPMAIVNGKVVNVGAQVGHYVVKQIARHEVTFQGDDGSMKQLGVGE